MDFLLTHFEYGFFAFYDWLDCMFNQGTSAWLCALAR